MLVTLSLSLIRSNHQNILIFLTLPLSGLLPSQRTMSDKDVPKVNPPSHHLRHLLRQDLTQNILTEPTRLPKHLHNSVLVHTGNHNNDDAIHVCKRSSVPIAASACQHIPTHLIAPVASLTRPRKTCSTIT